MVDFLKSTRVSRFSGTRPVPCPIEWVVHGDRRDSRVLCDPDKPATGLPRIKGLWDDPMPPGLDEWIGLHTGCLVVPTGCSRNTGGFTHRFPVASPNHPHRETNSSVPISLGGFAPTSPPLNRLDLGEYGPSAQGGARQRGHSQIPVSRWLPWHRSAAPPATVHPRHRA